MELRHLRYLVAVSEETTFVRAAERLRLAQPALSRQIHSFEKELKTLVFNRGRVGVTLTVEGAIALSAARTILRQVDEAAGRARMADVGRIGRCSIYASVWSLWSGFSGRLVAYLAETEPGIVISPRGGRSKRSLGRARNGRCRCRDLDKADTTLQRPAFRSSA